MKKLPLAFCLCVLATPALAADWTPYLTKHSNVCGNPNIFNAGNKNDFPKALRNDIKKISQDEYGHKTTYHLNNATYFGYPITTITKTDSEEDSGTYITFKQFDYNKMLNNLKFTDSKGKTLNAGTKQAFLYNVKENQNDTFTYTFVKSLPYPTLKNYSNEKLIQHFGKQLPKGDYTASIVATTPTGWVSLDWESVGVVELNKKNKQLSCYGWIEYFS